VNPHQGDIATFLQTSQESGGKRTLLELEIAPGGRATCCTPPSARVGRRSAPTRLPPARAGPRPDGGGRPPPGHRSRARAPLPFRHDTRQEPVTSTRYPPPRHGRAAHRAHGPAERITSRGRVDRELQPTGRRPHHKQSASAVPEREPPMDAWRSGAPLEPPRRAGPGYWTGPSTAAAPCVNCMLRSSRPWTARALTAAWTVPVNGAGWLGVGVASAARAASSVRLIFNRAGRAYDLIAAVPDTSIDAAWLPGPPEVG